MKQLIVISFFITQIAFAGIAQSKGYFVHFTDKNYSDYSIERPEEFLSQRAIDRRLRQHIAITKEDLPVSPYYTDSLKKLNIDVRYTSKWLNGAIVFSSNHTLMDTLTQLDFISEVEMTYMGSAPSNIKKFKQDTHTLKTSSSMGYGKAWEQIQTINGHQLHEKGYTGEGMQIAVIDAGFQSADHLPSFQHLWDNNQILGTRDFVNPQSNIFEEHYHGMKVLSIMGGKIENEFQGTAPDASYWLIRTEDAATETPIEPDYWICAIEFADSLGIDIINTSLGYTSFDYPFTSYTYATLDGTSRASSAAEIASNKGMILVTSAGNAGSSSWKYIGVPADAKGTLAIAAMKKDGTRASFSSYGPSYDQRVKPDITAVGQATAVQGLNGDIELGNGTSYSSPVIAGMIACLWQSLPNYSSKNLIQLILESSNQYANPDDSFGYGIPDFNLAFKTEIESNISNKLIWTLGPNPFSTELEINTLNNGATIDEVSVSIYDMLGNLIKEDHYKSATPIKIKKLNSLAKGLYIVIVKNSLYKQHFKVLKR